MRLDNPTYITSHQPGDVIATHRHHHGYAALVLAGTYLQLGLEGPVLCTPGTLLIHPRFHLHGNRFQDRHARVINLRLPDTGATNESLQALDTGDPARALRLFCKGIHGIRELRMAASVSTMQPALPDWQRALVNGLGDGNAPVGVLARQVGVSPAHASRSLRDSHGMSPQQLRLEIRWRRALALLATDLPLAEVAATCGFSDQAHFCRVTQAYCGTAPGTLRRRIKCVQDTAPATMA